MESKKEFYDSIDGLRAYSAIGILMMHVLTNADWGVHGFVFDKLVINFGNFVLLFMIISAFSMCCGYYNKVINNEISFEKFYSKRFEKIWPYFAMLCLLDFIISPSLNSFYEVFANLTLCYGLLPNAGISVIGVGWFLGVVFVFYMIFPFYCYIISNKRRAWFSFSIAIVFNILCVIRFDADSSNLVYSAVFFFAGGLIYLYRDKLCNSLYKSKKSLTKLISGGITLIFIILVIGVYARCSDNALVMLVLFSLILIWALNSKENRVLSNSFTKFLSSISLEIYLSHMVVYRVIEKIGLLNKIGYSMVSYVLTVIITLCGTIMFSVVAKRFLKVVSSFIKN